MGRPRVLLLGLISALLVTILAIGLWLDNRSGGVAPRAPIPASALAAFQSGEPITNPTQAFIAAQFYLGTTRLHAVGDILPYQAGLVVLLSTPGRSSCPVLKPSINLTCCACGGSKTARSTPVASPWRMWRAVG